VRLRAPGGDDRAGKEEGGNGLGLGHGLGDEAVLSEVRGGCDRGGEGVADDIESGELVDAEVGLGAGGAVGVLHLRGGVAGPIAEVGAVLAELIEIGQIRPASIDGKIGGGEGVIGEAALARAAVSEQVSDPDTIRGEGAGNRGTALI